MSIDVATSIARILKQEGVEWVSTFPVCRVNNALGREGVPMIMMRDDRYAVALADAYSRVTGGDNRIGVCTVQGGVNGAGLQYSYPGLAQAFRRQLAHAVHHRRRAGGQQREYPVRRVHQPQDRHQVVRLHRPAGADAGVPAPRLLHAAQRPAGSRGAGRAQRGRPSTTRPPIPYFPTRAYKSAPDPSDVTRAIDLLMAAANPLIYAGEGVIYAGASEELVGLAELLNAPVITTLKAKGAFPENHPLFVGVRGEHPIAYLNKSDVILTVGSSLSPGRFTHGIPNAAGKTIIQCNLDDFHLNRIFPTHHAVLGDAKYTLQALADEASRRTDGAGRAAGNVVAEIRETRDAGLAEYREAMASGDTPINPYRVFGDMMKVLDPYNSFVTHESGNTRDQLSTVYDTLIPRGFLGWGNISTLGFGLAGVMAAKLAFPERQTVAVTGDAGVGYMLGNLEVPVRQQPGHHHRPRGQRRVRRLRPRLLGRRPRPVHAQRAGSGGRQHVPGRRRAGPVHRAGHRAVGRHTGPATGAGGQRDGPALLPGVHLLPVPPLRRLRAEPGGALSDGIKSSEAGLTR